MQVLRAVLNYASLKYEVDGEPLIPVNPVSRLTQMRSWHKIPTRQGVVPDHKLADWFGGSEHRLPLSDWLMAILTRRYAERKESPYVFPGLGERGRYYGAYQTLEKIREQTGCYFILHDLRRVFLTTAEKLDIPHYALKKLAGHSMREDITAGYLVVDVERLRQPMQRITDRMRELMQDLPTAIGSTVRK